jgi:hypothetical protein
MFSDKKSLYYYGAAVAVVAIVGYFGMIAKQPFETKNDEKEMIRKYLLNDSPLYGFDKPKLWIHSKYELNARKWKSFGSRSSTDLNQPWLHLTIKTIINHCSDHFHICLIDDEAFSQLIPGWDIDVATVAEPMKVQYRELGLAQLLHIYGGLIVPNSFLCMRSLITLYEGGTEQDRPFICETANRSDYVATQSKRLLFTPDASFMGAKKHDPEMRRMVDYLKMRCRSGHFSSEAEFLGYTAQWYITEVAGGRMTLMGGESIGVKTAESKKPILLESMMEDEFLDLHPNAYGIYIPGDEILKRPKYQWFAVLPADQILEGSFILAKYLKSSMVDVCKPVLTVQSKEIRNVIAI